MSNDSTFKKPFPDLLRVLEVNRPLQVIITTGKKKFVYKSTVADFDKEAARITKEYNKKLENATSRVVSPNLAKDMQGILDEYMNELPTEEFLMRNRKQIAMKLTAKILADLGIG